MPISLVSLVINCRRGSNLEAAPRKDKCNEQPDQGKDSAVHDAHAGFRSLGILRQPPHADAPADLRQNEHADK